MSDVKIVYADQLPLYIIVESIHVGVVGVSKLTWNGASVGGAGLNKIWRWVAGVSVETEWFQDGEQIHGSPTAWQAFKDLVGIAEFQKRRTDKRFYTLLYSGGFNRVETFGYEFGIGRTPISYGQDPVPNIRLAGNKDVTFHTRPGGEGAPRAMATYDKTTGTLTSVPPQKADAIFKQFLKS